jgi:hypothetical protein
MATLWTGPAGSARNSLQRSPLFARRLPSCCCSCLFKNQAKADLKIELNKSGQAASRHDSALPTMTHSALNDLGNSLELSPTVLARRLLHLPKFVENFAAALFFFQETSQSVSEK